MVYLFSFSKFFGFDRVFCIEEKNIGKKLRKGDLLKTNDDYLLVLGDEVAFKEIYTYKLNGIGENLEIAYKGFFSKETIELINFLVYNYYSTYKKILNLFLNFNIEKLFKEEIKKDKTSYYNKINFQTDSISLENNSFEGQQLVVYPDIYTFYQYGGEEIINNNKDIGLLTSFTTQKQKDKMFWNIKKGFISTLFCTHSQIFKEWKDLKNIIMIDSHKWYYKNQQDPRYSAIELLKKLSSLYSASFIKYGYDII